MQLELTEKAVVEADEERVCSVKTVVAEFLEALSTEEVLLVHFQEAGRKDREGSYAAMFVLRGRRLDSSRVSFQALSVIKFVVHAQEPPCWLFGMRK